MTASGNGQHPLGVLMVEESAIVVRLFSRELERHFDLRLVATAREQPEAKRKVQELSPDVIVLDLENSRMDTGAFLANVMERSRLPVIALCSPTDHGAELAINALASGAFDVLYKPDAQHSIDGVIARVIGRIRSARGMKAVVPAQRSRLAGSPTATCSFDGGALLAIGAGGGGIAELEELLANLPPGAPPAVAVQSLPARVTALLARRLNRFCNVEVREATEGDRLVAGRVLIAPGGQHLMVRRIGADFFVHIKDGPEVCHQKPSVDLLFHSVARAAGRDAIGIMLSRSGMDAGEGLLNLRKAGGHTIASEGGARCAGAERTMPIAQMAKAITEMALAQKTYRTAQ